MYLFLWLNQKLDIHISCPKTTIDILRLPAWSAKLLKSWYIIVSLVILILVLTSLDLKETTALINVYYVLKEIIDAYRVLNGSVFTCFLDASKAFDRVNHSILFGKLSNRGIPQYVIRMLSYWYKNQQMCVRWGGTYSTVFSVTNGVRQGSIACRVGCCVGMVLINHIMYADDLVILAPSVSGLSKLLSIMRNIRWI